MLDEDLDLKAKITDVLECAVKEVIALVEADRGVEKNSAEIAGVDDGGAARSLLAARQCGW
jgi:hypothetical protein